jgi:predicted PurR-regulated permease PerM
LGASLAFVLNVPMRSIEGVLKGVKREPLRRVLALVLTILAIVLVLTLIFLLLIPQISDTFRSLIPKLTAFIDRAESFAKNFLSEHPEVQNWLITNTDIETMDWSTIAQDSLSMVGNSVSKIWDATISTIGSITDGIVDIVIAIVFSIYCLCQKETLARQGKKLLYAFLPEKASDYIVRTMRLTGTTFSNFLSGQCIEVCILGIMFALSMTIFRLPYAPLVSVLVAVTAFIPVVGAWVGCVLGTFFILVANPIQAVWFLILFCVLQQIENNLIYPRVVGTSIGLSGMWVLVAITVGGELMGVAGMLIMIPIASVLYTLLSEVTHKYLNKKEIDPEKLKEQPYNAEHRFKFKSMFKWMTRGKKNKAEEEDS